MISVELIGGLGNQMFQYAAGMALAQKHKTELFLDISGFKSYKTHSFGLNTTQVELNVLNPSCVELIKPRRRVIGRILSRSKSRGHDIPSLEIYQEKGFNYDPGFRVLPDNVYLKGYFQSEKYFTKARKTLLEEFKPNDYKTALINLVNFTTDRTH